MSFRLSTVVGISTIPAKREYAAPAARNADETWRADAHTVKVLHLSGAGEQELSRLGLLVP
jgi:hypothetical protein